MSISVPRSPGPSLVGGLTVAIAQPGVIAAVSVVDRVPRQNWRPEHRDVAWDAKPQDDRLGDSAVTGWDR